MADTTTLIPGMMGGSDGGIGAGGGLIGGLILGSLLRGNGGGGLFGGGDSGAGGASAVSTLENSIAAQTALTNARFDAQAQAAILSQDATNAAALGVQIAKGQGEINTQNALNAAALGVQIQKTAGDTQTQVAVQTAALGVQTERTAAANALAAAMQARDIVSLIAAESAVNAKQLADSTFALSTQITADGNQTRALITTNNNEELNRRLVNAQNEIIELRGDNRLNERTRGIEITTTNNINQMQQQQQQQAQFGQLYNAIFALGQNIQATNSAINVGTGTQTANPLNNNTNIR
jgi:hypothetical protein